MISSRRPPASRLDALAFFGGGTGGHLFPGIAVAERARERFPGCRAVFFRTGRAVEEKIFAGRDVEVRRLDILAPKKGVRGWCRYLAAAAAATREAEGILSEGFDAVFGLGGYASLPGILAARFSRLPVILLEQNEVPGKVNRLLSRFVDAVSCPSAGTASRLGGRREVTGNPVRRQVLDALRLRQPGRPTAAGGKRTVLVIGGSQGAQGLNRALLDALPHLFELRERIRWIHIAGDADKDGVMEAYQKTSWEAEVHGFAPHLPFLMAESDLVLARSGGSTVSELSVLGVPSVLVPYPHHKDQHQLANALHLAAAGGARLLKESEFNGESLRAVFRDVLFQPERLAAMGKNAQSIAHADAADRVLDVALDLKRQCPRVSESFS